MYVPQFRELNPDDFVCVMTPLQDGVTWGDALVQRSAELKECVTSFQSIFRIINGNEQSFNHSDHSDGQRRFGRVPHIQIRKPKAE